MLALLSEARVQGLLGPVAVEQHVAHARALAACCSTGTGLDHPDNFLDLGSGAGVPGLVLAREWPSSTAVFLDARERSAAFLEEAVVSLALDNRVAVCGERAEDAARSPRWRARFGLVVARAFGRPAVAAECAVGFLRPGGRLVVSEPPDPAIRERWPEEGLARLGFGPALALGASPEHHFVALTLAGGVDERWPRRPGVPAKRPLW